MGSVDGLVREMLVSFRREINKMFFFIDFGDSDDSGCVVGRSLAT